MVGLEAHLTLHWGLDFTLVATSSTSKVSILARTDRIVRSLPWEARASELGLNEELTVKDVRSRVERRAGDGRIDEIGGSDRVTVRRKVNGVAEFSETLILRDEEPSARLVVEVGVSILKTGQDGLDSVCRWIALSNVHLNQT